MMSRQGRSLATLRRSQQFLTTNDGVLGTINQSVARAALDSAVTQLATAAASQSAGSKNAVGATARQVELRQTLREVHMKPIATIAREQLASTPEFKALRMPPSNASVAQLVAWATSMAEAATANAAVFTSSGLDADFATQLTTAAAAVRASVDTRAQSLGRQINATTGLKAAEKSGMSALRVINAIVVPRLSGNLPLLAEWKSLSKVSAKLGPVVGTTVPVAPVAPVAPAAPAAPAVPAAPAAPAARTAPVAAPVAAVPASVPAATFNEGGAPSHS
jgi:hypothetical protein